MTVTRSRNENSTFIFVELTINYVPHWLMS